MSLRPNIDCIITPTTGQDVYGQETSGEPFGARCAIVRLKSVSEKTSVRTDSSASRGRGHEFTADARLLFMEDVPVSVDDKIEVQGMTLRVMSVFPRHSIQGRHDHNQVDCEVWA